MIVHKKILIKSIGWRLISLAISTIVIFLIVKSEFTSIKLIIAINLINLVLYYLYELLWMKIK